MKKNREIYSHKQAHSFAQLKDRALGGAQLSKDKEIEDEKRRMKKYANAYKRRQEKLMQRCLAETKESKQTNLRTMKMARNEEEYARGHSKRMIIVMFSGRHKNLCHSLFPRTALIHHISNSIHLNFSFFMSPSTTAALYIAS